MRIPMPAAVLAGGASRRMGRPKAALPYGGATLLEFQTRRLAELFAEVFVVVKEEPAFPVGPARVLYDRVPQRAAIFGLVRAIEETDDRVFVLGVDLPGVSPALIRLIAARGGATQASALVPRADGRLQPLAAVWRRSALDAARGTILSGRLALQRLAEECGAEILEEAEWRSAACEGAFANLNTLEDYAAHRERA